MAKELPRLNDCKVQQKSVCRESPCVKEDFDPRSYCHNILAKPSKICKKIVCRKFLRANADRTKGETVCVTRKPCQIKRYFGPNIDEPVDEDELFYRMYGSQLGVLLNEGTVSETDLLKGKFGGKFSKFTKEEQRFGNNNIISTKYGLSQDEETAQFLDDLSKFMDPEAFAALAGIAGAEICPCCECVPCKCKLRGVTSEMLLSYKRKGVIEQRVKHWGKGGYAWTFDYFYRPNLDIFEQERMERLERERQAFEEERKSIIIEEMIKEQKEKKDRRRGIIDEDLLNVTDYGSQTGTYTSEAGVQAERTDKIRESFSRDLDLEDDELTKLIGIGGAKLSMEPSLRKEDEFMGAAYMRSSLAKPSIESWVESREVRRDRRPTITTGASEEPLEEEFPDPEILGPIRLVQPEVTSEKSDTRSSIRGSVKGSIKSSIKSSLKSGKRSSASSVVSSIRWKEEDRVPPSISSKQTKEDEEQMQDKSAESISEEEEESSSSEESIDISMASSAVRLRVEQRLLSITPSLKPYTDVCKCLPGACVCSHKHYLFKEDYMDASTDKMVVPVSDKQVGVPEEGGEEEEHLSVESSCICVHPWDDSSRSKASVLSSSKYGVPTKRSYRVVKCVVPKFQQTLIIIKPEAMKFKDVILRVIKREGLSIVDERTIHLSPEQVAEIYNENIGSAYFAIFIQQMSSSPILVLYVAGLNAIKRWKNLIGLNDEIRSSWFFPESMKRRFGIHCGIPDSMKASTDYKNAKNELRYFFPLDILEPIMIESQEVQDYCDKYIHATLLKGLFQVAKNQPSDPLGYLAEYILKNNPFQPTYLDPKVALART